MSPQDEIVIEPDGPARRAPIVAAEDSRSIPDLIRRLASESQSLLRKEVELAKAEMREKLSVLETNASRIGIGAGLALVGLAFLLWAVNMGVTALFSLFVDPEVAIWLAPLVLGLVLALVGVSMAKGGLAAIRAEGVTPHRTVKTLKDDKEFVESEVRR